MNKAVEKLQLEQTIEMGVRLQAQQETQSIVEATIEGLVSGDKLAETASASILVGRIQMANAVKQFANVGSLQILKNVKETKDYKNLKGLKLPTGEILQGTWEEFCKLIGESKSSVDERLKNLEVFGQEALESMQSIGMGIRDLRRLRQLPENELKAIVDGDQLTVDSKEEALDIIEEMAAKHRAESTKLNEKLEHLELSSKASDQLLEKKGKQIHELEKALEIAKGKGTPAQIKQLEAERNKALSQAIINAKYEIFKGLAAFEDAVAAIQDTEHPCDLDDEYHGSMNDIISRMMEGSARVGLDQTIITALNNELMLYQQGSAL
ncbi:MarR family transcriptional regulator [Shewanella baltica]|uniref:hypothetical protein n=1 Tax=Shewanella baltica TaxID=62322 RepID=UPI00217D0447|nr:hypothetical protein [Shewanella baltica]MCS6119727.1 MarR family transcriptional regulator [Shewanella baltica]